MDEIANRRYLTPADCQPMVERFAEKQSKLGEPDAILALGAWG